MSTHDETEAGRDKYVHQWLSRVLRQDHSHTFEPPDGIACHRTAQEHRSIRSRDYHRRHEAHQRQGKESISRPQPKSEEHRDKRLCAERAEIARSPSNGPYHILDRPTLDTPFRKFERQCHIQPPPTAPPAGQHPATISSSPLSHIQRSKLHKTRVHVDLTARREDSSQAGLIPTSAAPNLGKEYGRKPRRKTRLDRYEPKDTGKSPRKSTRDDKKKKSNPKKGHRRLSKAVIGEEFKAPNVKQDRLSLTTKPGLGLFRNGKTSSPKRRRNLPDLSFSEMGFLAKRKDPESQSPRNKGSGKEISHYFSQKSPVSKSYSAEPDRTWAQRRPISSRSCSAPDISQTAGSRAIHQPSSGTKRRTRSKNSLTSLRARGNEKDHGRLRSGCAKTPSLDKQHTEPSTTCYTWSASDHRISEPIQTNKQPSQRGPQEHMGEYPPRLSIKGDRLALNPFKYKAEGILSQNMSLTGISRKAPPGGGQRYLTLEDLHYLAGSKVPEKPDAHVSQTDIDAVPVKDSLNNGGNEAEAVVRPENASKPNQAEDGDKNPTVTATREVLNAPIESSGCPRAEKANSTQDIEAVDLTPRVFEHHPLNGLRNEQPIETTQPKITQARRIQVNGDRGTLPSEKEIEPRNACATQFLGVGACRSHFWTPPTIDKAQEHIPSVSMAVDCPPKKELDETRFDDYRFDFSGLDSFDREVLETGSLNQTVQTEDNLDGYSHHSLSFLPSTAPGIGEGVLDLLTRDASPCLSDTALLFPDPRVDQLDVRLPITGANNRHGTNVLTHRESKYADALPSPGLNPSSFAGNHVYMRGSLGGYCRSTPVNVALEPENWGSSSWQLRNEFGGRGGTREGLREGVSCKTPALNGRQKDSVDVDRQDEDYGPAAFWRPNRLY